MPDEKAKQCKCCGYSGRRPLSELHVRPGGVIFEDMDTRVTIYLCSVCLESPLHDAYLLGVPWHTTDVLQMVAHCTNRVLDALEAADA